MNIYGIAGLAALLNCSKPTAQKIKNSGKIPFAQVGRIIIFDVEKVLEALESKNKKPRIELIQAMKNNG